MTWPSSPLFDICCVSHFKRSRTMELAFAEYFSRPGTEKLVCLKVSVVARKFAARSYGGRLSDGTRYLNLQIIDYKLVHLYCMAWSLESPIFIGYLISSKSRAACDYSFSLLDGVRVSRASKTFPPYGLRDQELVLFMLMRITSHSAKRKTAETSLPIFRSFWL